MAAVLKIIWRLIVITAGYALAAMAAGLFLAVAIGRLPTTAEFAVDPANSLMELFFATTLIAFVALSALVPFLVATLIAEVLSVRHLAYHLIAGAIAAAVAVGSALDSAVPSEWKLALAAGLVGGFVYWLIAGRRAGDWSPPDPDGIEADDDAPTPQPANRDQPQ